MIVRVWHGWTTPQNAPLYEALLKTEVFAAIEARQIEGFLGIDLMSREVGSEVEFVTMMRFTSLDAVRVFAGPDYEVAFVPPEARKLLARFDARSQHYELRVANGRPIDGSR